MSYTNSTGSATYTYEGTTLNTVSIGLSTTETDEYYAQHLLVASGGKLKQNIRVSNGGILENAIIDYYGASVGSGGLISNAYLSGAAASRTTFYVYSGGVASRITMVDSAYISTVLGATLADVIVSGGYFTANGATVTNVTLEKPLHYNTTTLAALGGAVVTNVTINDGTFSLTDATATSVTVNAGTFSVSSGGTASYINVAGTGNLVVNSGGTGVTLAGNVVTTATVMGGGYLSLNNGAVVSNIDVRPGGRLGPWTGSIISGGKIVGGNTATQPEVYGTIRDVELYSIDGKAAAGNSAWLRQANGSGINMRISSGGKYQVNSGTAEYTTVYSAGYLVVYGVGGTTIVNHTVISSGGLGSVYAGAGKKAPSTSDTWVLSGASLNLGVSGAAVDLMVNPGAILTLTDTTASASVDEHPWLDKSCITAVEGATVTYERLHNVYYGTDDESIGLVSRGGAISGATVEAGYSAVAYQGVALTDVNVADGGKLVLKDYAYVMGGSANSVAAGKIYLGDNATADTLGIVGSQLTGLTLASNTDHSHLSQVTLLSGLTATNATMLAGGTLYISNGGGADGVEVDAGTINVYNGGVVANATISGATTANRGFLYLREAGAVANNVTLLDNAYASNYKATVNDLTISGGYFTANGVTINGATLDRYQNVTAGTTLDAISGTTVSGVTVNYGTLVLRTGALASDTTINGGTLNVSGGDAKASGAVLLAGAVSVGAGATLSGAIVRGGAFYAYGVASDVTISNGGVSVGAGATLSGAIVRGGAFYAYGIASDVTISNGGVFSAYKNGDGTTAAGRKIIVSSGGNAYAQTSDAIMTDVTVYNGGKVTLWSASVNGGHIEGSAVLWGGGKLNDVEIVDGAKVDVNNGAVVSNINATGGVVDVKNGGTVHAVEGAMLTNLRTVTGATVDYANGQHTSGAMIRGDNTNIAANTLVYSGAVLDATVVDGVMTDLGANGNYYRMRVGTGISVVGAVVGNGHRLYAHEDAEVVGATINTGGNIGILGSAVGSRVRTYANYNIFENGTAKDTIVENGGVLRFNAATAKATGTVVSSGGTIRFQNGSGGGIDDTTLKAGAALELYAGAQTGDNLYLDFEGSTADININDLALVGADTAIHMINIAAGNTYAIASAGDTNRTVNCEWSDYSNAIKAGESYTNAFTGMGYSFNAAGTEITTTAFDIGSAKATAGSVTTADAALNTNDRAAKWDANTTYTDSVTVAGDGLAGDAWLEIDGTNVSTALYGAEGSFGNTVNIYAKKGTIRNLAAGAKAGGSVAGVMLTVGEDTEFSGVAYAGGFGGVTGKADTYIAGGTFSKDFYAGALANKNAAQTTVGEVALSITGGTFKGNVYGASAVKTDTTVGNDLRNATGDVTISVTDGSTDKQDFCLFAGGYATGDATGTVYTVESVTANISGGSWGTAAGGRGIFGGIMASGVTAQAGNVNLTVSGDATMGNVYGGGWAQQNGTSTVGNVSISIEGGKIANVFGGGSHSTSGGATEAGNVTITVSGGTITGDIYARGHLDGDTTGAAKVIFTGDTDFGCGVYGYTYVGSEDNGAALGFTDYTGTLSGGIGGFDSITFDKDVEMDLTTESGNVSNRAWEFDLTGRADALAGTSLLTWSTADFANDTVKVNFANDTQAKGGWNIATVAEAFAGTTFDVEVGGTDVATGLAYNQKIASGDYQGWGFGLEDGVLKFKQLA